VCGVPGPSGWVVTSTGSALAVCSTSGFAPIYTIVNANPSQAISFSPIASQTLGVGSLLINASASSNLPVTFSTSTPSVCSLSNINQFGVLTTATVNILSVGTCTISADQSGSLNFIAAPTVTRSFAVNAPPPTSNITQSISSSVAGSQYVISWTSTNAASCNVDVSRNGETPTLRFTGVSGSQSVTSSIDGSYVWRNTCQAGSTTATSTLTHIVTPAAPPVTASISQSLSSTASGSPYVVSWSSSNATSCVIDASRNGETPIVIFTTLSGSQTVSPTVVGTHVWRITCQGSSGSAFDTFTHTVTPPSSTASISQSLSSTVSGSPYVVSWSSSNATSCAIDASRNGETPIVIFTTLSGSQTVSPTVVGTHVWRITCQGDGGGSFDTFTHTVTPPPSTASISQSLSSTVSGSPYVVSWSSTNATSCALDASRNGETPNVIFTGLSGSQTISPVVVGTHVWRITCQGDGGSSFDTFTHTVTAS
jgi:large repetitive protein